ncbi:MAG: TonB-dependent receptor [Dysgonamonadaceae bacterium]|nr:TonB-dependent receptor [Dysgonamonadaceae bacterium]
MKANRIFLSLIVYITSVFSSVYAETVSFLKDTVSLKEVIVVSTAKTDVNRDQIPFTVSVVDREMLDISTETGILSILSEQVPGLFVTQKGVTGFGISDGSAGTVNIHGVGGGNKVLMLFDGQPMWAGIFGHSIADAYVASDAEKVEVIRGPGSLLYGSNALGGVINVITRKADADGIHGRARAMYGSYNTQKYLGSAGYKKDKLNIYASVNHDRTDGHRDNSEFYITNAYVKAGYLFSKNWDASADAIIADFKTVNPGTVSQPMSDNWAKALRTTYSVALNNRFENMDGSVQAFYNNGKHKINDGHHADESAQTSYFKSNDFNQGIAVFESFRLLEGNLFTLGFDAKQWGGKAWNEDFGGNELVVHIDKDKKVTELAGYLAAQQTLTDKLTLNAGIRMEHNKTFGNEWIPQGGAAYRFNSQTTIKASASKGFRSPNIRDLYMWGVNPNPDLRPESMTNYDFSYLQSLLNNHLHFEVTVFYAHGKSLLIQGMYKDKYTTYNTGKFINKGFDFGLSYNISPDLKFSGNYSFLDSDIKITASPKHKAFVSLGWNQGKWTIAPNYQYVGGLYLAENATTTENYSLLNCNVSYKVIPAVSIFLNGENLTDASYETYAGFPMPGTTVLGGINWRF